MTHHVPYTESSPTPSNPSPNRLPHTTPKPMCDKTFILDEQNSFAYKPKAFWMIHHNDHFIYKIHFMFKIIHLCVGSKFLVPHHRLRNLDTFMPFHRWGLCFTIIGGLFTRGRIYPFLLIPITYFIYHFNQLCDSVGRCPIEPSPPNQHKTQCRFINHALTPI